ncbi:MAG: alanine--glyoxylate aminotransferase family protein [Gemmatimonadales bacterium]|nr:MAG: alanine--glyoxylate aminotransferase family protein [Gemmatimonadales bacterium]
MTPHADFGRFFLPGPTEVHPDVLAAMRRPVIAHRGPEMHDLLESVDQPLRLVFGANRPVYVSTSSATGFMEAAITNLSRRRALCLVNGAFGARFHAIAERCGRLADRLDVPWGLPNTADQLREALIAAPDRYDLVTVVHSETSTGVLNPVDDLAAVVSEFDDVLLAVDGVTSVGGMKIEFERWGVDFMLTGSQKALALPPGLAFATASDRALERAASIPSRSYYFDLVDFHQRAVEYSTTNTPAVSLIFALQAQLERIEKEGLGARFTRHDRMARRTAEWTEDLAGSMDQRFEVLALDGFRSPTVTAIALPDGSSGPAIVRHLADEGITIATGYGILKDSAIRIGHMGDHTEAELEVVLDATTAAIGAAAND